MVHVVAADPKPPFRATLSDIPEGVAADQDVQVHITGSIDAKAPGENAV